jgi:uncharacterized protein (DUF488 family)
MIYSIGHGNKTFEYFLGELLPFNIRYLIDVRTNPYSKHNPKFNREVLEDDLKAAKIIYVYMGDSLGGLPNDSTCYIDGKVSYDRIKDKDFFKEGLARLITAYEKKLNVALMCSETKPEECHRSKLIGEELRKKGIIIEHIISPLQTKNQEKVIYELTHGKLMDLFGNEPSFTSIKTYE